MTTPAECISRTNSSLVPDLRHPRRQKAGGQIKRYIWRWIEINSSVYESFELRKFEPSAY